MCNLSFNLYGSWTKSVLTYKRVENQLVECPPTLPWRILDFSICFLQPITNAKMMISAENKQFDDGLNNLNNISKVFCNLQLWNVGGFPHTFTPLFMIYCSGWSRISQRRCQPRRGHWPINFPNFCQKLHGNEKILDWWEGARNLRAP